MQNPHTQAVSESDVQYEVQSVKRLVSNFLGLLHDSIQEQEDVIRAHHPVDQRSDQSAGQASLAANSKNSPEKKLSTILSASEVSSGQQAQNSKSEAYQDTHRYEEYFGSSSLEEKFVGAFIALTTDRAAENAESSYEQSASSVYSEKSEQQLQTEAPQAHQKGIVYSQLTHKSKSQSSVRPTTIMSDIACGMSGVESERRILNYDSLLYQCDQALGLKHSALAERLKSMVRDFNNYISLLEERNNAILVKQEKYRVRCDHLYKAVESIREAERGLVQKYVLMRDQLETAQNRAEESSSMKDKLNKQLEIVKSENSYLKELIMLANKNYEGLEKKLMESELRVKKAEADLRKREMEMLEGNGALRDTILRLGKENIIGKASKDSSGLTSPFSKRQKSEENNRFTNMGLSGTGNSTNLNGTLNGKSQVFDTYRRMFIKTLKNTRK